MVSEIPKSMQPWYRRRLAELRAQGLPLDEAKVQARAEVARAESGQGSMTDYELQEKLGDKGDDDWKKDLVWVYENLEREHPDESSAPSRGAVGLLAWARDEKKAFYAEYFRMRQKHSGVTDDGVRDDTRRSVAEIDDMLDALLSQGSEER